MRAKFLAIAAGSALALTAVAPAHAESWDGDYFSFGYGAEWQLNDFYLEEIYLGATPVGFTQPSATTYYTDIWDGGLKMFVSSPTLGMDAAEYTCTGSDSNIDIAMDGDDLSIDCLVDWDEPNDSDVSITGNIRIYGPDGDLVRTYLKITNNSGAAIDDFEVETTTDFGSSGDIWGYQNYDANILPVPADDNDNSAALEEAGANWLVNIDYSDPSGSLAWGNDGGAVDVMMDETSGDTFYTRSETFTVADGETVYIAYFTGWNPANLVSLDYSNPDRFAGDSEAEAHADLVVADSAEFDNFSGRLTNGFPAGANVINWGPISGGADDLAETGADVSSLWAGLGLLVAGVGVVAIRRRTRA